MTEEEWAKSGVIRRLWQFVEAIGICTVRKAKLFAIAICQRLDEVHSDNRIDRFLFQFTNEANGVVDYEEYHACLHAFRKAIVELENQNASTAISEIPSALRYLQAGRFLDLSNSVVEALSIHEGAMVQSNQHAIREDNATHHVRFVRDIFGNPFRPVTFDPRWRTSSVLDLASGIYDQRAFDRMPILADALMDTGCDNDDIIQHCRGPGLHVKGCWVVDLILGKE